MPQSKVKLRDTKTAIIHRLLRRRSGATLAEIAKATSWQPHSCRTFLSGIRKSGDGLVKEKRKNGAMSYRLSADSKQCDV